MNKSKRVMRRLILSKLFDYLKDEYAIVHSREAFLNGDLSRYDIDALLAFKSDARLDALRNALDRLEDGTYGVCISCKSSISQDILDTDPTQRICASCEKKFIHVTPQPTFHHLAT